MCLVSHPPGGCAIVSFTHGRSALSDGLFFRQNEAFARLFRTALRPSLSPGTPVRSGVLSAALHMHVMTRKQLQPRMAPSIVVEISKTVRDTSNGVLLSNPGLLL